MKNLKTNHEAMHMLTDRAREYLAYKQATLKGASDELYLCYPNGKKEWLGDINTANKYLETLNRFKRLTEWCYLQKAEAIACGKKPLEYYNYCYSVEEGGDLI